MALNMFLIMLLIPLFLSGLAAQDVDPAKKFIEHMDKAPSDKRVPNWEQTKTLMARIAPKMGEEAPDFSLPTLDGKQRVKLSQHKGDRPVVLIFGSFT